MKRLVLLIALTAIFQAAALPRTEIEGLCRESEQCFDEGNTLAATDHEAAMEAWRKAAARLERAVSEGHLANGPLFYNLGNIYFRMGDMGRAILNYRRAERFTPNDTNLQRNLSYARRSCQDSVREQEAAKVMKTLFFWHYDIPASIREGLFIVFFCGFWLVAILRLRFKRPWSVWLMAAAAVIALAMAASLAFQEWSENRHRPGVILAREVVARKGNSESYDKSFKEPLHAGTEFTLLELRDDWMEIKLADGKSCWIKTEQAELVF